MAGGVETLNLVSVEGDSLRVVPAAEIDLAAVDMSERFAQRRTKFEDPARLGAHRRPLFEVAVYLYKYDGPAYRAADVGDLVHTTMEVMKVAVDQIAFPAILKLNFRGGIATGRMRANI